jgi:hypothetical protein
LLEQRAFLSHIMGQRCDDIVMQQRHAKIVMGQHYADVM